MKFKATLSTKDSQVKQIYEDLLSNSAKNNLIDMLGGIENVYSKAIYKNESDEVVFGIGRIERDDEYEYLLFWGNGFEPKDGLFNEFSKEISHDEFLKICEEENIEME